MEGNPIVARLRRVATEDSRELDRVCEEVARSLRETGTEPPFRVTSADFAADPFLICADRYWRLRFLEHPTVRTAAACASWLQAHGPAAHEPSGAAQHTEVLEKWALGYAFITRDSEETPAEIAEACGDLVGSGDIAYFATLYHAGKLRANFRFDELHGFLESSLLALAAGPHRGTPLFTALRAFAACGSRRLTAEHAADLLDHAWYSPQRTVHTVDLCLNALAAATPFPRQGELLRDRAHEAATQWPENHIFALRLATGLHLCREYDEALEAIDLALALLPAIGTRGSHRQLQEQYLAKRELILEARRRAAENAAHEERWRRQEATYRKVEAQLNSTTGHLLTMVTVFLAAIAFILSTVQLTYGGDLPLGDRMLLILGQGTVMLAFSGLLVLGTHLLLRYRPRPEQPQDPPPAD
ncbi:hypothetical protein RM780_26435 [Streptomyces sp. DSM 44917]|uniref:Tetratricopeptide repeat protein n=1 Tax=Streptomyces boetiae TaxID=3075541 RepID=A0ABU2LFU0_9ACTN|nr:hypothetical protein [Streptomyces sp. DSM 44917]MDT0310459.1 hypothetical protein [Streptomyces sp. DSM 44917]